jgi:3-phenylpropionate/trans-cinnamate dioxygenase ferredoxin subunit
MSDSEGYSPLIDEKELQEGQMKVVRAEGKPVLFVKQKGKVYVIDDRCPHMGCKFSGGSLDGEVVICPCHEWRFNLESGEYEEDSDYVLTAYPFKVVDGKIWVKLEEDL